MITLTVILYDDFSGLEATWLEEGVQLKCHSYHPTQMDMFRTDAEGFGTTLEEYETAMAEIEAAYTPPEPEPIVIADISPRQIRMALTRLNLRAAVEEAVAGGEQDIKDWWEFSTIYERNHPVVISMSTALGATEQQMDGIWLLGGTL